MKWRKSVFALGLVVISIIALGVSKASKTESKVDSMTAAMNTVCVGRFQMDVPARSKVSYRGGFISGWNIRWNVTETDEDFAERVKLREKSLNHQRNERGGKSLERTIKIVHKALTGKIWLHSRVWVPGREDDKPKEYTGASLEAHVRAGETSITFTSDVHDAQDIPELTRLVSQIRPILGNSVPHEKGFCFGPVFIRDPITPEQNERVTMFMSLDGHPDVAFAFDTAAGLKPSRPLLERQKANDIRQQFFWAFKTIRSGDRAVAGIAGQESGDRIRELNGKATHDFTWESLSDQENVYKPEISIELSTGHPLRAGGKSPGSSLADEDVIQLWDKILASVHVRPVLE